MLENERVNIKPSFIHGDFSLSQSLVDPNHCWFLDLDDMGRSDPAIDVAAFTNTIPSIQNDSNSELGQRRHAVSQCFLDKYIKCSGDDITQRIKIYKGALYLRQACVSAFLQRLEWKKRAVNLIGKGVGQLKEYRLFS